MIEIEIWRPVAGFEGSYEVSRSGLVRSVSRTVNHTLSGTYTVNERVLRSWRGARGHRLVTLSKQGVQSNHLVHRLVLGAFVGPCPVGLEGCHSNGDPTDNRLSNLRWDTPSSNHDDSVRHGTHFQASKNACKHGHEFTPENTHIRRNPNGRYRRDCKTCKQLWNNQRRECA